MLARLLSKMCWFFKLAGCGTVTYITNLYILKRCKVVFVFCTYYIFFCLGSGIQGQGTPDGGQPLISSDCVSECNETSDFLPSASQSETKTKGAPVKLASDLSRQIFILFGLIGFH